MGKGAIKHEEKIISDVREFLSGGTFVISQNQLVSIISKYYSSSYSEAGGYRDISRALIKRGIVVEFKVKIPLSFMNNVPRYNVNESFITLFMSSSVPKSDINAVASSFVKNMIHSIVPSMRRSVSRELLNQNPKYSEFDNEEFFSLRFRASLLHFFLVTSMRGVILTSISVSSRIPLNLYYQIISDIDTRFFELSPTFIVPTNEELISEIDLLLSYLKPPYHTLIIDNRLQTRAMIEIPHLAIRKEFNFLYDLLSHYHYWTIISSFQSEEEKKFPIVVCHRFDKYLDKIYQEKSLYSLPFFPRSIEKDSIKYGVGIPVLSYYLSKQFKKRLKQIHCAQHLFLESKLFPSSGIFSMLANNTSALSFSGFEFAQPYQKPYGYNGSVASLAYTYNNARLLKNGLIRMRKFSYAHNKDQILECLGIDNRLYNIFDKLSKKSEFVYISDELLVEDLIQIHLNHKANDDVYEVLQKDIVKNYKIDNVIRKLNKPISVAFEFIKVVLHREKISEPNSEMISRQLCHFLPEEINSCICLLDSLGMLRKNPMPLSCIFPSSKWDLSYIRDYCLDSMANIKPHPLCIFFLMKENKMIDLKWEGYDSLSDYLEGSLDESNLSITDKICNFGYFITEHLYKLPPIEDSIKSAEIATEDPLIHCSFARFDSFSLCFNDFLYQYIYKLFGASSVEGIGILEILKSLDLGIDSKLVHQILSIIDAFVRLGLVIRVPSSNFEPSWSRFSACHSLFLPHGCGMKNELLHVWVSIEGDHDQVLIEQFRHSLSVYIFAHEYIDFLALLSDFPYISPYDMCILLNSLECDEVVSSQYLYLAKPGLFIPQSSVPIDTPSIDVFLATLSQQQSEDFPYILARLLKSTKGGFSNLY